MKVKLIDPKRKRQLRVRAKIQGTAARPRFSVARSSQHLQAQLIDDAKKVTILGLSTSALKTAGTKTEKAIALGSALAKKAIEKGIKKVVFDRGEYRYHGRVKALADAARKEGLEF